MMVVGGLCVMTILVLRRPTWHAWDSTTQREQSATVQVYSKSPQVIIHLYSTILYTSIFNLCTILMHLTLDAGSILLDDVDCSYADRFQDCSHRGWGVHNCYGYTDTIGLICNPGSSLGIVKAHMYIFVSFIQTTAVDMVTGLRTSAVSHTSITVEWDVSHMAYTPSVLNGSLCTLNRPYQLLQDTD